MAEAGEFNFGSVLGNSVGEAVAFAAGLAIGPLLAPLLRELENTTWSEYPDRPLDPETVAAAVAEGLITQGQGSPEAAFTGTSATRFGYLVELARHAPAVAEALALYRRNAYAPTGAQVTRDQLHLSYQKASIDPQWWAALDSLALEPYTPQEIALGIVRSVIADPGLLVTTLDTSDSNVPRYAPVDIDPLAEAAAAGIDREHLRGLVGQIGLPMSTQQAASAYFRGIITLGAFNQSILEGDVRPEWAPFILEQARQILTPHEYAELYIRGWISQDVMYAGTALHGMSQADSDLLVENIGRPLAVHQVTTGLARGGTHGGDYAGVPEPYLSAIRQSNIRPEWGNLAYANRYTYPSYFVIKPLVSSGAITVDEATQIFENEGWPPDLAAKAAQSFAASGTTSTSSHVKSASTARINAAKKAYLGGALTVDAATAEVIGAGETAQNAAYILEQWTAIKQLEATVTPPTA